MLNVERGDDVDARAQKREHIEVALGSEGAGRVGMRELIDQHDLRLAREDRVPIHLGVGHAVGLNRLARNDRKVADHRFGFNAFVRFDVADDDVDTFAAQLMPTIEHGVGFTRAGCSPEINGQLPIADAHPIAQRTRERRRERGAFDVRLFGIQNGDVTLDRCIDEAFGEFAARQNQQ